MLIIDIKSLYDTLQNAYIVKFKLKSSLKFKIKPFLESKKFEI
jgi:hypothetical protein